MFALLETAMELGLIYGFTVLALFLSYSMLGVCDLSTDGCFTLGAAVGSVTLLAGHPLLSLPAAMAVGALSGFMTAALQTRLGVDPLLSGIIANTGLYSVNIAVMGGSAQLNLNRSNTLFTLTREPLAYFLPAGLARTVLLLLLIVLTAALLSLFLRTRLGLAIRATGDNPDMVRSSSINPAFTTTVGLCLAGALTGLSGCLLAQYQRSAEINMGSGILTVALASLLIGRALVPRGNVPLRATGAVAGAFLFRLVYALALQLRMPAYMLKLTSAVIVALTIALPYLKKQVPLLVQRQKAKGGQKLC